MCVPGLRVWRCVLPVVPCARKGFAPSRGCDTLRGWSQLFAVGTQGVRCLARTSMARRGVENARVRVKATVLMVMTQGSQLGGVTLVLLI